MRAAFDCVCKVAVVFAFVEPARGLAYQRQARVYDVAQRLTTHGIDLLLAEVYIGSSWRAIVVEVVDFIPGKGLAFVADKGKYGSVASGWYAACGFGACAIFAPVTRAPKVDLASPAVVFGIVFRDVDHGIASQVRTGATGFYISFGGAVRRDGGKNIHKS